MVDTSLEHLTAIRAGRRFAMRYRLDRPIASGATAVVWLATDEYLQRPVAVKMLHPHLVDPAVVERFRAEGRLAAQLAHPGIVAIYDRFCDRGIDGIVLEYVEGQNLRARLDAGPALSVPAAIAIARRVGEALVAAHRRGLVHCDIKPANVLLGSRGEVKVTDFGIATFADRRDLATSNAFVGTAKYLAPEQVTGAAIDGRADVYALGVVLYEMLLGAVPFSGDTDAATALARLQLPAPDVRRQRDDISEALAHLVASMLERSPERRPSAADVVAALERLGPAPESPLVSARDRRALPVAAVAVGVVLVFSTVLAAALLIRSGTGRSWLERVGLADAPSATISTPMNLASATLTSFDPGGDNLQEHPELLRFLIDANPDTVWTTEQYATRAFGGRKSGVGVIIDFGRATEVSEVVVHGSSAQWQGAIYLSDHSPENLTVWGEPRAQQGPIDGSARFVVGSTSARSVLLWITDLGPGGMVRIGELEIRGPS